MSKYIQRDRITQAIHALKANVHPFFGFTYLAAKQADLPIATPEIIALDHITSEFMRRHFKPHPNSDRFFHTFRSNDRKKYWVKPDYPSSGLQKLNTSTMADAFIHEPNSGRWAWDSNYVEILASKLPKGTKIPLLDLAIWIYWNQPWNEDANRDSICSKFIDEFHINRFELDLLFDQKYPHIDSNYPIFQDFPVRWHELLIDFFPPPDVKPSRGGILHYLEARNIGPMDQFHLSPGERLNLITGDNGLGKTFILDLAWWSLTGEWASDVILPRIRQAETKGKGAIKFAISSSSAPQSRTAFYRPEARDWVTQGKRNTLSGLVVYARVDGSFAIWDPATIKPHADPAESRILRFSKQDIWEGKTGRIEGLIRDWTKWQDRPDKFPFEVFSKVLATLSPPDMPPLKIGPSVMIPGDPREIPTIRHDYDDVPVFYESAGIQRIVALAYFIVWAWENHKRQSEFNKTKPENRLVILIDEVEAHLHPKWQRSIMDSLITVGDILGPELNIQYLLATHSPLILASCEQHFDDQTDSLFHLMLTRSGKVQFDELPFIPRGPVDAWLTSETFGLDHARGSVPEKAIKHAIRLQESNDPSTAEVSLVHNELTQCLAEDDEFWPRWILFAAKHGVL